jgi:hypothetical protein
MFQNAATRSVLAILAIAAAGVIPQYLFAQARANESAALRSLPPSSQPPTEAEIEARARRLVANQHRDDEALTQYERIERHTDYSGGPAPRIIDDRIFRVIPTGTGNMKIVLKENGTPTDPVEYRRQLKSLEELLELMLRPNDSRAKTAYEKFDKRNNDRAELVDSMVDTFSAKWLGRETLNGHSCDVFELAPKPDFHPHSIMQDALTHISAKIWVDDSDQMVRGEARILRDISFIGGLLGKVYRGGVFSMEQSEVAQGVWEPTRYQYDFGGRKFLFSFVEHQVIEASHYHRVGAPQDTLIVVQNELASAKPMVVAP